MARTSEHRQPGLFDAEKPLVKLHPPCRAELAALVEALLGEIAATLARIRSAESTDEQDHF